MILKHGVMVCTQIYKMHFAFLFYKLFLHYGGDNVSLIYLFVDVHMYVGCGIKSIIYDTIDYILSSLPIIKTREQIGFLFVFVLFKYVLSL